MNLNLSKGLQAGTKEVILKDVPWRGESPPGYFFSVAVVAGGGGKVCGFKCIVLLIFPSGFSKATVFSI